MTAGAWAGSTFEYEIGAGDDSAAETGTDPGLDAGNVVSTITSKVLRAMLLLKREAQVIK
jgi:hypothetical protein